MGWVSRGKYFGRVEVAWVNTGTFLGWVFFRLSVSLLPLFLPFPLSVFLSFYLSYSSIGLFLRNLPWFGTFIPSFVCFFLNKNQTTVEWRPHWYRLQGHKIYLQSHKHWGFHISIVLFLISFLWNNSPTTSNLVQDLGDNVIEAEGDRSIVFHASFTVCDSCTTGILAVLYYLLHCTWKNLLIGIVAYKPLLILV